MNSARQEGSSKIVRVGAVGAGRLARCAGLGMAISGTMLTSAFIAGGALVVGGCAGRGGNTRQVDVAPGVPKELFTGLTKLAARQQQQPDAAAQTLPPPPGVATDDVALLTAGGDVAARARASVDEAIAAYAAPSVDAVAPRASAAINPRALRLYASGRTKVLDGQAAQGVTDLEAASRLDAASPEIWRELGQAQLDLGRRTSAMSSFQRALRLGLDEPRVLVLLARDDLRGKRYEDAARKLAQARRSSDESVEAGLRQLLSVDLAEALLPLGYVRAARDLLSEGLQEPVTAIGQSPLRNELAEIYRRRGDLWLRVGDLSARLGEFDRASGAYDAAAESPTLDPEGVIARRVFAHTRQGHSAAAALAIVNDIHDSEGRVEDRHMAVIAYLSQGTQAGAPLAEAIGEIARSTDIAMTPTVQNRLARAAAAALKGDDARAALRAQPMRWPVDADLAVELIGTYPAADFRGRARECLRLVEAQPLAANLCAGVLLNRGQGIDETVKLLEADDAPAARLLSAALLNRLGRPDRALARLGAEFPAPMRAAALAGVTGVSVANGDWEQAFGAERKLTGLNTPDAGRADVFALQSLQQFEQALRRLEGVMTAPGEAVSTDDLLLAAELASHGDDASRTEEYLQRALARDRFDERSYEPLLTLYAPSGALHSDEKLTGLARELRQSIPSSRVIRGISAQDLVARSLWSQAEPQLFAMLAKYNENGAVINLLVRVWERAAQTDPDLTERGAQWLRESLAERPDQTLLLGALARVMAAQGKGEEAQQLLAERLAVWPLTDLAHIREWIVREPMEKPEEADKLAAERLEHAPPNLDNAIERAELLVRTGDVARAADVLVHGVPTTIKLTDQQSGRLLAIIARVQPDELARKNPEYVDAAIHLLDLIAGRGEASTPLQMARLSLIAIGHPDQTDQLVAGVEKVAERDPEARLPAYGQIAAELGKHPEGRYVLRFLEAAAKKVSPPNDAICFEWFRLTAVRGNETDVEHFADALADADGASALLTFLERNNLDGQAEGVPSDADERKAEVMYQLGLFLTLGGREELSEMAYRVCLRLRPTHAWANNNLGYQLLERGKLHEAEALISVAYESLADNASVVDSMGWVLYKQGKLADTKDAEGNVREGAVSLLMMAVKDRPDNTVIADHAADALWRAGGKEQQDQAREMWSRAQMQIRQEMADPRANDAFRERSRPLLDSLSAKVKAVQDGGPPPIAPIGAEPARAATPEAP